MIDEVPLLIAVELCISFAGASACLTNNVHYLAELMNIQLHAGPNAK
jgi:hypothetical protein